MRDLQTLAKRAGAQFAVELHKLRKTGARWRYLANEPLTTLMLELEHESLATISTVSLASYCGQLDFMTLCSNCGRVLATEIGPQHRIV